MTRTCLAALGPMRFIEVATAPFEDSHWGEVATAAPGAIIPISMRLRPAAAPPRKLVLQVPGTMANDLVTRVHVAPPAPMWSGFAEWLLASRMHDAIRNVSTR